ncbi:MAG: hypothetical protein ABJO52_02160, partial [Nisaea sp.]|uniref:hypothetical protein n=1 Tax=Nisaea sp. TaxID=2024842 RepID=UPI0032979A1C
ITAQGLLRDLVQLRFWSLCPLYRLCSRNSTVLTPPETVVCSQALPALSGHSLAEMALRCSPPKQPFVASAKAAGNQMPAMKELVSKKC